MQRLNASYYRINLAIASVLAIAIMALLSVASVSYENTIFKSIIAEVSIGNSIDNEIDNSRSERYDLDEQPLATPFFMAQGNSVPSAQSLTKLSQVVSSIPSLTAYKDIQTHHILADYHMAEILSLSHQPSVYYIFALNRMRD